MEDLGTMVCATKTSVYQKNGGIVVQVLLSFKIISIIFDIRGREYLLPVVINCCLALTLTAVSRLQMNSSSYLIAKGISSPEQGFH